MNEPQFDHDTIIDEALNRYEPAPIPPDFVSQVMSQIEETKPVAVQPRFKLDFLDWAIPLFASSFVIILFFIINRWRNFGGLDWIITGNVMISMSNFNPNALYLIGLIVLAEIFIAGAVGIWLWVDRPGNGVDLTVL